MRSTSQSLAGLHDRCAVVFRDALPAHGGRRRTSQLVREALLAGLRFRAFDEVPRVLRALRAAGVPLVVVSNWDVSLHGVLRETGLDALLDGVLTSAEEGISKPDPEIFRRGLALAGGVPPEQARYVGDDLEADVGGAQAAGIVPVLIDRDGTASGDDGADGVWVVQDTGRTAQRRPLTSRRMSTAMPGFPAGHPTPPLERPELPAGVEPTPVGPQWKAWTAWVALVGGFAGGDRRSADPRDHGGTVRRVARGPAAVGEHHRDGRAGPQPDRCGVPDGANRRAPEAVGLRPAADALLAGGRGDRDAARELHRRDRVHGSRCSASTTPTRSCRRSSARTTARSRWSPSPSSSA